MRHKRWKDADNLVSQLTNDARSQSKPLYLSIAESLQAELELRRGRVSKAARWLDQCEVPPCEARVVNLSTVVGYIRVLLYCHASRFVKLSDCEAKSRISL